MIDLVLAENLPVARGIAEVSCVLRLKNFRQPKSAGEAVAFARMRDVLLYSSAYEFDGGVFSDLKKSGGALVFSFADVLAETGFRRAIAISKMRLAFSSCRKTGCGFVFCTLAKSSEQIRNAHEIGAFMAVVGLNQHEIGFAKECAEMLARETANSGGKKSAEENTQRRNK